MANKPSSFESAFDSNGNFPTTLGSKLDPVNDAVTNYPYGHSYQLINSAATTTVKSGSGVLHAILITNAGATSNTIKIYDNTTNSGSVILDFSTSGGAPVVGLYPVNIGFSTGLTIVTAGTTSPVLTVIYR